MRLGTATQLACELTPYALVALVVSTAALGAPLLAPLGAAVALAMVANAALGRCDLATWFLGDAPRSAYDGATVWITGASQGLGEALALHLASLGARLILSSRREETLRRVCDACEAAGARAAVPLVLDARAGSPAMRAKGAEALEIANRWAEARADPSSKDRERKGLGLDYVFHVAGGSQHAAAEDTADEVDRDMFELNVLSAIALTKAVLPAMLERRAGAFCVVGSMAAKCPAPGQATYAATKAALAAFFHSLRGEVADRGVAVTVAHPGPIATGLDGQTRVVFGATLDKSTTKTVDAEKPTSEGAAAKEEEEGLGGEKDEGAKHAAKKSSGKREKGRLDAGVVARRVAAGAAHGLDEVVLATQPIMLLRNFVQFVPTVAYRILDKVGPKRTRAARAGKSMYELKG
jgi:dehydrogenase/reductase SDR family protein 7